MNNHGSWAAECAVSVAFLKRFQEKFRDKTYQVPPNWNSSATFISDEVWRVNEKPEEWKWVKGEKLTTKAVVEYIIRPDCKETLSRYASLQQLSEAELWAKDKPPFTFISHAWGNTFDELVAAALELARSKKLEETFVWIDIFASASLSSVVFRHS